MNLSELTGKAKDLFKRRGGAQAAKEDAQELKDIAHEDGGTSEKAKDAVEAIKDPGVRAD